VDAGKARIHDFGFISLAPGKGSSLHVEMPNMDPDRFSINDRLETLGPTGRV
jgi:hypothetical protein